MISPFKMQIWCRHVQERMDRQSTKVGHLAMLPIEVEKDDLRRVHSRAVELELGIIWCLRSSLEELCNIGGIAMQVLVILKSHRAILE